MKLLAPAADITMYLLLRTATVVLAAMPPAAAVALLAAFVRFILIVLPRYRRICLRNLQLAFPELSEAERSDLMARSCTEVARLVVDSARLPYLDRAWVEGHVEVPFLEQFRVIKRESPQVGVLIATGHLGSFELLGATIGILGNPLHVVVRNFKLARVNRWWEKSRQQFGNTVISRAGAFKEILAVLSSGQDVAVLFDQNVKQNHAVFVDWFGTSAATTKTVALAALRTGARIVVASIAYRSHDKYFIMAEECAWHDIGSRADLSPEEKVQLITQRVSTMYTDMIKTFPQGWFWMHRRWKTRPVGEPEKIYA